ncbi:hypothetical protein RHSIM_Rhsim02G0042100 [Rhododendron simsii]|uniref:Embryo sac development arrest 6 n=1 Tax=Rhododendron simsii TaxID=118357 RepID=A0A834HC14_RHOSS|nr:hypothetical protein RHSIM_Rhsim02G0042100 [Rhododendron simsii]
MSHHHPRRILTPSASRKRKEMEALYPRKPPAPPLAAATTTAPFKAPAEPVAAPSNRLLAGYMAHEFLTKGTLLGQKWDPARAEAVPVSNGSAEPKRPKPAAEAEPSRKGKQREKHDDGDDERYAEVARLLKEDGAHVAGIVNPTQLARWIQM